MATERRELTLHIVPPNPAHLHCSRSVKVLIFPILWPSQSNHPHRFPLTTERVCTAPSVSLSLPRSSLWEAPLGAEGKRISHHFNITATLNTSEKNKQLLLKNKNIPLQFVRERRQDDMSTSSWLTELLNQYLILLEGKKKNHILWKITFNPNKTWALEVAANCAYNHRHFRCGRTLLRILFTLKCIFVFHAALVPGRNAVFLHAREELFQVGKGRIY